MKRQQDETTPEPLPLASLNSSQSNHHNNEKKHSETEDSNRTQSQTQTQTQTQSQSPCARVRLNEAAWDSLIAGMLDACPRKRLRGRPRRDGLPPQPRPKAPHPPTALLNHFVLPPRSPPAFLTLSTSEISPASLIRPSWVPSNPSSSQGSILIPGENPSEPHPATKKQREEERGLNQEAVMMLSPPSLTSPFPSPTQPSSFSSSLSSTASSTSTQSRLQVMQIQFLLNAAPLTN